MIITNCEGLTNAARAAVVKEFEKNPNTKEISQFMRNGIVCVGFPEVHRLNPDIRSVYDIDIKQDQERLSKLLHSACSNLSVDKLLKYPPIPTSDQNYDNYDQGCCLM